MNNRVICPKCREKKYELVQFQPYEAYPSICPDCIEDLLNKELIEVEINGFKVFVPKSYLYYIEYWPNIHGYGVKRGAPNYEMASPPKVNLVNGLFELSFDSCDSSGYDVAEYKYYFKTKEDVLNFLQLTSN